MSGRSSEGTSREARKKAAAEAAVKLVEDGMIVGLGTGSTAAFALAALGRRVREGLQITGIPTSQQTRALAQAEGIPLTTFAEHQRLDLTIDGAQEVERDTLNLVKGLGGALLAEKIVAAASQRLVIIVDDQKLVDQLGSQVPVPVEVTAFGLEATAAELAALGASARMRHDKHNRPVVTESGNRILDCKFEQISAPGRLEQRLRNVVGVVETGLYVGRAHLVLAGGAHGVKRLQSPHVHRGSPPILVLMGVSGSGKTTIGTILAERLGWPFQEGDDLHPPANRAKMHAGIPLTDDDRRPWLKAVANWIDGQRRKGMPGIITCSALKRAYRDMVIGERAEVRLVYLRGPHDLIAGRLARRTGHFMPASLLQTQYDTLEPPTPDEDPIVVDIGPPADEIARRLMWQLDVLDHIDRFDQGLDQASNAPAQKRSRPQVE